MTIETYTFGDQSYTYERLFDKTPSDLAKLFNAIVPADQKTKRFSDKTAAVKRTWAALKAREVQSLSDDMTKAAEAPKEPHHHHKPAVKAEAPTPAPKPKKEPAAKKEAGPKKKRGRRFVFPSGEELKYIRPGTHRHQLVMMTYQGGETWHDGATFAQCVAATWGKEAHMDEATQIKTTYEGLRLLHYFCGYGMDQDDEGRITLFFNGTKKHEKAIEPKRNKPARHGG